MSFLWPRILVKTSVRTWWFAETSVIRQSSSAFFLFSRTWVHSWIRFYFYSVSNCFIYARVVFLVIGSTSTLCYFMWGSLARILLHKYSFKWGVIPGLPEQWIAKTLIDLVRLLHIWKSIHSVSWVWSRFKCNNFLFLFIILVIFATIFSLCALHSAGNKSYLASR
jgi:hypothetical protein